MKVALCQMKPETGEPIKNAERAARTVETTDADLFIFPEMFLTGYACDDAGPYAEEVGTGLKIILEKTSSRGKMAVVGGPDYSESGIWNACYFISDAVGAYRKIHLPGFGPFSEKNVYIPGTSPATVDFGGFRFGFAICYDIFFPELAKRCAMDGADCIVCISASPKTSKEAFERVLPARAVEDTCYLAFVNNVGRQGDYDFFGCSRMLSPTGAEIAVSDENESVAVAEIDRRSITEARKGRPTLDDTRNRAFRL